MKRFHLYLLLWIFVMIFSFGTQTAAEKEAGKKTPPGLEKKQGIPPGQTKKEGTPEGNLSPQWVPLGQLKKIPIPAIEEKKKYQQTWCLGQKGQVNVGLPDTSVCDCLTDTHAIAFAFEDNWMKAIGQALYHAVALEKQPGIVIVQKPGEPSWYGINIDTTIKHFTLPITLWILEMKLSEESKP